jgi:L-2-hydroxyglutarate oxidase LhgO
MKQWDVVIIGAGILGLSTALQLLNEHPHLQIAILEKEAAVARHQTGHNSGVIHSGIYYKPGSLKAQNCISGIKQLLEFCDKHEIRYDLCGKVIVATSPEELPRLEELERRGKANGVEGLEMIGPERLKEIEPAAAGIKALYSPKTGIIDYVKVAQTYASEFQRLGGVLLTSQCVKSIGKTKEGLHVIQTDHQAFVARMLINCAGFYADRIAHLTEKEVTPKQIIPFRGEYYELVPEKRSLIKGLIYPVPDPKFPFLGVHLSRTIEGFVEAGPNAVLALSREGYTKNAISLKDSWDILTYKGFWRMAARYWRVGLYELYRSYSKKAFLRSLQKLVPELQGQDLVPTQSGVRSQVITKEGKMVDDFLLVEKPGIIHVLNAPSPAATASLAIGSYIASRYHSSKHL